MHIVSLGDNLHEMSRPLSWEKIINLLFTESAQRVVKIKTCMAKKVYAWQAQMTTRFNGLCCVNTAGSR